MKKYLRRGDYQDLNLYYLDRPLHGDEEVGGYCHFPKPGVTKTSETFIKDGCIMQAASVPHRTSKSPLKGSTTVHEVNPDMVNPISTVYCTDISPGWPLV